MRAEFAGKGVEVVAINLLPQFSLAEWQAFWRSVGGGEVLWAQDTNGSATKAYNILNLGTTVIVDREGRIAYRDEVATRYEKLRSELEKVL